jgi:hypothetical protein
MQSPRVRAVLTGAVLFILSASAISAQTPIEKTMTLRLTDPSGAVVANGIATLKSNQTAQTYSLPLDLNKEFLLPKLSPGSYILVVEAPGFRKVEQVVELADATPSPLQVVLQVAGSSTTVSVTDSAARDESYEVVRNTSASRVDLPLLDIPQDVATVPRAVLQDQRAMNLSDATRNVAGAATDFGFNGGSEPLIILRGFQATSMTASGTMSGMSSYYVDGTKVEGIPVDMADVQTVEVIKGPESVLYGRAEPGGIVNVVPRPRGQYRLHQENVEVHGALKQGIVRHQLLIGGTSTVRRRREPCTSSSSEVSTFSTRSLRLSLSSISATRWQRRPSTSTIGTAATFRTT